MRCPRILAKVICCGLARVRKMDELAKDRFRRLEQTLSLSAGTARFMPHTCRLQYLSGSAQLLGNRAVVLRSILLPA